MKRLSLLLLLFCTILCTHAQLLWKISGHSLSQPSYIFGSHHLAPISLLDRITGFHEAFDHTEQVYGEIAMDEMTKPESIRLVQQAMAMPGDTTLKSLFTPEEYGHITTVYLQLTGVNPDILNHMKPSVLTTQLSIALALKTIKDFNPQEQIDTYIQQTAREKGKNIGGLENLDTQLQILYGSQSLKRQAHLLYCAVTHLHETETMGLEITQAYMAQNIDRVLELIIEKNNTSCDALPEEEEILIFGRNAQWAKQIPTLIHQAPTLFVVGCAHLPGQHGVLHLLREQGYTVEPVK